MQQLQKKRARDCLNAVEILMKTGEYETALPLARWRRRAREGKERESACARKRETEKNTGVVAVFIIEPFDTFTLIVAQILGHVSWHLYICTHFVRRACGRVVSLGRVSCTGTRCVQICACVRVCVYVCVCVCVCSFALFVCTFAFVSVC